MTVTIDDHVTFELHQGGERLAGDVIDIIQDAEYGAGPYQLFVVDVPGQGSYRVRGSDIVST